MVDHSADGSTQAAFGLQGLDDILAGGLERDRVYLLEGAPGTGKTTAAMSFLLEGARLGEGVLYITLSETEDELRATARSHGWSLDGMDIFELVPPESLLDEQQQQSLLYSSDLELGETTRMIFEAVEARKPRRVVIDSLSEIRLLAQSSLRYRRQVLALKHYFAKNSATVLLLDDLTTEINDKTVHSVAHGVIQLQELAPNTAPSAAGSGSSNIAADASGAATTTSPSRPAGSRSIRASSRPSIAPPSTARRCPAASPNSMRFWAAGWNGGPAP